MNHLFKIIFDDIHHILYTKSIIRDETKYIK